MSLEDKLRPWGRTIYVLEQTTDEDLKGYEARMTDGFSNALDTLKWQIDRLIELRREQGYRAGRASQQDQHGEGGLVSALPPEEALVNEIEQIADWVESLQENYPLDIFPADGVSRDAIAAATLRRFYPIIADMIRSGEWRKSPDE